MRISTLVSIVVGALWIGYVAIDRSSEHFTIWTLFGYVFAAGVGLLIYWALLWLAVIPLGGVTRLDEDNPSKAWLAIFYVLSAFAGAGGMLLIANLLRL